MGCHKKNWKVKTLEELCQFQNGYSFKNKDYQHESINGYVVFRMGNINRGGGLKKDAPIVCISKDQSTKLQRYVLNKNDIVMCMTDVKSSMDLLGHTAVIDKDDYYILNQRVGRITVNREDLLDYRYLFYYTNSETYLQYLRRMAHSGVQVNLSTKAIKESPVLLPPLPIQRKIAAILSNYDDLIENNTRRIKILEEMAQTIYREWFVEFRFPGYENVRMVESELGLIPQEWKVVKIEQIVKRVSSGKKYNQKTVEFVGSIPVLDQGQSGIIGYHNDSPGVTASEDEPIIVFANHTCCQRIIQYPFSAIQNVLPFLPHPERHRDIYWLHWATKDLVDINDYKGHWPEFMSKEFVLPPTKVCEQFGVLVKPMVRLVYKLERCNQNLRQTRDLLLPKLISGELDVSDLDIGTDLYRS